MKKKYLERYLADHVYPGTLKYIKKLAEAGFLSILEIRDFQEHEDYDDVECLDEYSESFEIVVDSGKIRDGYCRYADILKALDLEYKPVTEFIL